MEQKGIKRIEVVGQNDKRLITAIFVEVYREIFCLSNLSTREKLCIATHVMSFHLGGISPIHLIIDQ